MRWLGEAMARERSGVGCVWEVGLRCGVQGLKDGCMGV